MTAGQRPSVTCAYCVSSPRFEVTDSERGDRTLCCGHHLFRTVKFFHEVLHRAALVDEYVATSSTDVQS